MLQGTNTGHFRRYNILSKAKFHTSESNKEPGPYNLIQVLIIQKN
jgi:hypothetical protein